MNMCKLPIILIMSVLLKLTANAQIFQYKYAVQIINGTGIHKNIFYQDIMLRNDSLFECGNYKNENLDQSEKTYRYIGKYLINKGSRSILKLDGYDETIYDLNNSYNRNINNKDIFFYSGEVSKRENDTIINGRSYYHFDTYYEGYPGVGVQSLIIEEIVSKEYWMPILLKLRNKKSTNTLTMSLKSIKQ
jgi:hypothetical protein